MIGQLPPGLVEIATPDAPNTVLPKGLIDPNKQSGIIPGSRPFANTEVQPSEEKPSVWSQMYNNFNLAKDQIEKATYEGIETAAEANPESIGGKVKIAIDALTDPDFIKRRIKENEIDIEAEAAKIYHNKSDNDPSWEPIQALTDPYAFFGTTLPKVIGGMAGLMLAPLVAGSVAGGAAAAIGSGGLVIAATAGIAGLLASRPLESVAEAQGAFDETKDILTKEGKLPPEEIEKRAKQAFVSDYNDNMKLAVWDAAEVALAIIPLGKLVSPFAKGARSLAARKLEQAAIWGINNPVKAGAIKQSLIIGKEGTEEVYQQKVENKAVNTQVGEKDQKPESWADMFRDADAMAQFRGGMLGGAFMGPGLAVVKYAGQKVARIKADAEKFTDAQIKDQQAEMVTGLTANAVWNGSELDLKAKIQIMANAGALATNDKASVEDQKAESIKNGEQKIKDISDQIEEAYSLQKNKPKIQGGANFNIAFRNLKKIQELKKDAKILDVVQEIDNTIAPEGQSKVEKLTDIEKKINVLVKENERIYDGADIYGERLKMVRAAVDAKAKTEAKATEEKPVSTEEAPPVTATGTEFGEAGVPPVNTPPPVGAPPVPPPAGSPPGPQATGTEFQQKGAGIFQEKPKTVRDELISKRENTLAAIAMNNKYIQAQKDLVEALPPIDPKTVFPDAELMDNTSERGKQYQDKLDPEKYNPKTKKKERTHETIKGYTGAVTELQGHTMESLNKIKVISDSELKAADTIGKASHAIQLALRRLEYRAEMTTDTAEKKQIYETIKEAQSLQFKIKNNKKENEIIANIDSVLKLDEKTSKETIDHLRDQKKAELERLNKDLAFTNDPANQKGWSAKGLDKRIEDIEDKIANVNDVLKYLDAYHSKAKPTTKAPVAKAPKATKAPKAAKAPKAPKAPKAAKAPKAPKKDALEFRTTFKDDQDRKDYFDPKKSSIEIAAARAKHAADVTLAGLNFELKAVSKLTAAEQMLEKLDKLQAEQNAKDKKDGSGGMGFLGYVKSSALRNALYDVLRQFLKGAIKFGEFIKQAFAIVDADTGLTVQERKLLKFQLRQEISRIDNEIAKVENAQAQLDAAKANENSTKKDKKIAKKNVVNSLEDLSEAIEDAEADRDENVKKMDRLGDKQAAGAKKVLQLYTSTKDGKLVEFKDATDRVIGARKVRQRLWNFAQTITDETDLISQYASIGDGIGDHLLNNWRNSDIVSLHNVLKSTIQINYAFAFNKDGVYDLLLSNGIKANDFFKQTFENQVREHLRTHDIKNKYRNMAASFIGPTEKIKRDIKKLQAPEFPEGSTNQQKLEIIKENDLQVLVLAAQYFNKLSVGMEQLTGISADTWLTYLRSNKKYEGVTYASGETLFAVKHTTNITKFLLPKEYDYEKFVKNLFESPGVYTDKNRIPAQIEMLANIIAADTKEINPNFRSVIGKQKSSEEYKSHYTIDISLLPTDEIQNSNRAYLDKNKEVPNPWVTLFKKVAPVFLRMDGIKNNTNSKSVDAANASIKDTKHFDILAFLNKGMKLVGNDRYFQHFEQQSDKSSREYIEAKKYTTSEAKAMFEKIKDKFPTDFVDNYIKKELVADILEMLDNKSLDPTLINPSVYKAKGQVITETNKLVLANQLAEAFGYNFAVNKYYIDQYFYPETDINGKKNYSKGYLADKMKRQLVGSGLQLNYSVMRAFYYLRQGFSNSEENKYNLLNNVVINDPVLAMKLFDMKEKDYELFDGLILMHENTAKAISEASGSIMDYGQQIKSQYSKNNADNSRTYLKGNTIVLTKEMADRFSRKDKDGNEINAITKLFYHMGDPRYNIDTIAFTSAAKKSSKENVNKVTWDIGKDGEINFAGNLPEFKQEPLDIRYYLVQQDLRQESRIVRKNDVRQQWYHSMRFKNAEQQQTLLNKAMEVYKGYLEKNILGKTDQEKKDWFLEKIPKTKANQGFIRLLKSGISIDNPIIQTRLNYIFANIIEDEVLGVKVPGAVATSIPNIFGPLKAMYLDKKTNKVIQPEAMLPAGYRKSGLRSRKDKIEQYAKDHPNEKNFAAAVANLRGDYAFITRVPSTELHSTSLVEIVDWVPESMGSVVATATGVSQIAGEDFDGDMRYIKVQYRDKVTGEVIKDGSPKGIMNKVFELQMENYFNGDNYNDLVNPIDTSKAKTIVKEYKAADADLNYYAPNSLYTGIQSSQEGTRVIGILARANAVYNFLKRSGAELKSIIKVPELTTEGATGKTLELKGLNFSKKQEALIRSIAANNLNHATDNVKEQNLEYLGLTEATAMLSTFLQYFGVDEYAAVKFMHNPVVQEYIKMVRESKSPNSDTERNEIYYALAEKYYPGSTMKDGSFDKKMAFENKNVSLNAEEWIGKALTPERRIKILKFLNYTNNNAQDFSKLSKLIKGIEDAPKSYAQLYSFRALVTKLLNATGELDDKSSRLDFGTLKSISFTTPITLNLNTNEQYYKGQLLDSPMSRGIIKKLKDYVMSKSDREMNRDYTDEQISIICNAISNYALNEALDITENNVDLTLLATKWFNGLPENSVLREILTYDEKKQQIALKKDVRTTRLDDEEIEVYRKAFDESFEGNPDAKADLIEYHVRIFGYGDETGSYGGFSKFFSTDMDKDIGEKMSALKAVWANYDKGRIEHVAEQVFRNNPLLIPEFTTAGNEDGLEIVDPTGLEVKDPPLIIKSKVKNRGMVVMDRIVKHVEEKKRIKGSGQYAKEVTDPAFDAFHYNALIGKSVSSFDPTAKLNYNVYKGEIDNTPEIKENNLSYKEASEQANAYEPIEQNFFDGYRPNSDKSKLHAFRPELKAKGYKTTMDLIKAGIRTRTTRTESWIKSNPLKVGDYRWMSDKKGNKVLTQITAIYPNTKDTWNKEGWRDSDFEYVKNYASAIEFKVVEDKKDTPETEVKKLLFTEAKLLEQKSFRGKPIVIQEIKSDREVPVGARNEGGNILINLDLLKKKYAEKAWTKPATQKDGTKATAFVPNIFKSFDEFLTFVLLHETFHDSIKIKEGETRGSYETRINQAALTELFNKYEKIKYQKDNSTNEKLASADPKVQEAIRKKLSKAFPGIKVFTNAKAFQAYLNKHFYGERLDITALGAAIGKAIFINPDSAVQSTEIHEFAHHYWDALPNNNPAKIALIRFWGTEEKAIQAIGEAGVDIMNNAVHGSRSERFKQMLKDFWAAIKNIFGRATQEEITRIFASNVLNNTREIKPMVPYLKYQKNPQNLTKEQNRIINQLQKCAELLTGPQAEKTRSNFGLRGITAAIGAMGEYTYTGAKDQPAADRGTALHDIVDQVIQGISKDKLNTKGKCTSEVAGKIYDYVTKYVADEVAKGNAVLSETPLGSTQFHLNGKVDMSIISKDGRISLRDWKFSTHSKIGKGYDEKQKKIHGLQQAMYGIMYQTGSPQVFEYTGSKIGDMGVIPGKYTLDKNDMIVDIEFEPEVPMEFHTYNAEAYTIILANMQNMDSEAEQGFTENPESMLLEEYARSSEHKVDINKLKNERTALLKQKRITGFKPKSPEQMRLDAVNNKISEVQDAYVKYKSDFVALHKLLKDTDLSTLTIDEITKYLDIIGNYDLELRNISIYKGIAQALKDTYGMMQNKITGNNINSVMDLEDRDVAFLAPSDMRGAIPEWQAVMRQYLEATQEASMMYNEAEKELLPLAEAVIKEKRKERNILSKAREFISITGGSNEEYFENEYDKKTGDYKLPNDPSLSPAEKAHLAGVRKWKEKFKDIQNESFDKWSAAGSDINSAISVSKTFWEEFHAGGFLKAFAQWLGNDKEINSIRLAYKDPKTGTSKMMKYRDIVEALNADFNKAGKIGLVERAKLNYQLINYHNRAAKALKAKYHENITGQVSTNPNDEISERDLKYHYVTKDGRTMKVINENPGTHVINAKGHLISSYQFKRSENLEITHDTHRAIMSYIKNMAYLQKVNPLMPKIIALQAVEQQIQKRPNLIKFIDDWMNTEILGKKEISKLGSNVDNATRFLTNWTYFTTMTFNIGLGVFNLTTGLYNTVVNKGFGRQFIGAGRLGNPKTNKKANAILDHYRVITIQKDPDPRLSATKIFQWLSDISIVQSEKVIQGCAFLGALPEDVWNNFDENGKIIDPSKELPTAKIVEMLLENDDIQGKYREHNKRNYRANAYWAAAMQFKTWFPDFLNSRLMAADKSIYGKDKKGITRSLVWQLNGKQLKHMISNHPDFWKSQDIDAKNARANLRGLLLLGLLFTSWASVHGDDDDKALANKIWKMLSQMAMIYNLSDFARMVTFPSVNTINNLVDAILSIVTLKSFKKDSMYGEKGDLVFPSKVVKLAPYGNSVKWLLTNDNYAIDE